MRKPTIEGQLFYVEEMDQLADELLEELSTEDPLQGLLKLLDTFRPVPNILSIEGLDRPVCEVMAVSSIKNSIESSLEQTNSIELGLNARSKLKEIGLSSRHLKSTSNLCLRASGMHFWVKTQLTLSL
ncbi:unnamed protein product [Microthlaspi erraticum]|uniref:Uncharacterized protein n=1 Tax=Microthlaspi erraticum TaxID=1685480 RepID=A0A6D2J5N5_9BRAS|nr:unnamed protein product [Microthlaspi erraticum]